MSNTPGRDWRRMTPDEFGRPTKPKQDALFLVDEPDACGTDAFDGYGYGATLSGTQDDTAPPDEDPSR
ncbi:hypothetical protein GCM10014715_45740 [Streptomyces spiralis]|uniref:Uncharacterized protein n=1 Tax=Streptomyces spiralis TaxID=66376 RepID=A0A919DW36_9ACTN|nr:hypothetical protein [Streptomyces spiralis]GHE84516.1 hypothetical protein GCM10014715_45740 [Streptomyces spiralis]